MDSQKSEDTLSPPQTGSISANESRMERRDLPDGNGLKTHAGGGGFSARCPELCNQIAISPECTGLMKVSTVRHPAREIICGHGGRIGY